RYHQKNDDFFRPLRKVHKQSGEIHSVRSPQGSRSRSICLPSSLPVISEVTIGVVGLAMLPGSSREWLISEGKAWPAMSARSFTPARHAAHKGAAPALSTMASITAPSLPPLLSSFTSDGLGPSTG